VGIYVPILLEGNKSGKFKGSFPFDPSYEVEGSRAQVIQKLYQAAAGYLQTQKCPHFLAQIKDYHNPSYSYLKLDLFSRSEHFFLGFLSMVAGIMSFALVFSFLSYLWFYFSAVSATPITPEVYETLEQAVRDLGWQKSLLFILFWNIFYIKVYPIFLRIYGSVLLLNSTLRTAHLIFITRLCTLFQSKPYSFQGDES
jgi:hypothetical protein